MGDGKRKFLLSLFQADNKKVVAGLLYISFSSDLLEVKLNVVGEGLSCLM